MDSIEEKKLEEVPALEPAEGSTTKKKKKKRRKKKKGGNGLPKGTPSKKPIGLGIDGFTDSYVAIGQTEPPTKPIRELFKEGQMPIGEIQEHSGDCNTHRITGEEQRAKERFYQADYDELRQAAEAHRQTRKFAQSIIRPGIDLHDMCEQIEDMNRKLIVENGVMGGMGFPCGCSINNVAAHYSPNPGDKRALLEGDVMKIDFGTQINGRIIDSAFTVSFDHKYDPLLEAVKAATNQGLKSVGIDAILGEVGADIQEVMESYEIELDGKVQQVKTIENLNGHQIGPFKIHDGVSIPCVRTDDTQRLEEGMLIAIETFGSTGTGSVFEEGECSHFMLDPEAAHVPLRLPRARQLLAHLKKTYGTLPFCRRWLERPDGGSFTINGNKGQQSRHIGALRNLVDNGLVNDYPPLADVKGSYTAQYEHTVLLRPTCKEILSRGDDY